LYRKSAAGTAHIVATFPFYTKLYHNIVIPRNQDTSDSELAKQSPLLNRQRLALLIVEHLAEMLPSSAGQVCGLLQR
jgi:hypothetical protein